jgi:hypothetical protein
VGQRHADRVVAPGRTIQQKPAALGSPRLCGQSLGALEGGRVRTDVDPLDPRGKVVQDCGLAQCLDQALVGPRALMPRDVEATRVARNIRDDGVEVRGFGLVSH